MKVLAIDGGGIRGLIPALVLAEIERRTERRIAELVDMIAGTSTGGILACALGKPDPLPAAEVASLYVEEGPKIFDRSLLKQITSLGGYLDERYSDKGLVRALERYLGDTPMTAATRAAAADRLRHRGARDPPPALRGRALRRLDGRGRPRHLGRADLLRARPPRRRDADRRRRVRDQPGAVRLRRGRAASSTSCSRSARASTPARCPTTKVKDWGQLEWARPVIDVVFDGGQDAVDLQLRALAPRRLRPPADPAREGQRRPRRRQRATTSSASARRPSGSSRRATTTPSSTTSAHACTACSELAPRRRR